MAIGPIAVTSKRRRPSFGSFWSPRNSKKVGWMVLIRSRLTIRLGELETVQRTPYLLARRALPRLNKVARLSCLPIRARDEYGSWCPYRVSVRTPKPPRG